MDRVRAVLGWVLPIVGIIVGAGVAARGFNLPSEEFWSENASLVAFLFWLTIATLTFQAVRDRVLIARLNRQEKDKYVDQMAQHLWYLVFQATAGKIPMTELAVHAWRPTRRWLVGQEHLVKVGNFQLHQRSGISIMWTKEKGVVGRCWAANEDRWFNLAPIQAAIATHGLDELPDEQRLGMTNDEITRGGAYWAIYATPLKDEHGKCIGVVSVDSSERESFQDLYEATHGNVEVDGAVRLIEMAMR